MEERLHHAPHTKRQIKDALYHHLYSPILKQFSDRLEALVIRNALMLGSAHRAFSYKGISYTCSTDPMPRRMDRLNKALHPAMDAYLAELQVLNDQELPHVLGFINQVLNSSNELHDYLRLFPAAMHPPIADLIASCPCRTVGLSPLKVKALQTRNQATIDMVKHRLMINLLM